MTRPGLPAIRRACAGDIAALDAGLRALGADLGDTYRATTGTLRDALFRPEPVAHAQLAEGGLGLALYTALFSTVRGGAGAYVSDLWVAPEARGSGLGARLLAAVASDAQTVWGARFLKLAVYETNPSARAVYERLDFEPQHDETTMVLAGTGFDRLKERR